MCDTVLIPGRARLEYLFCFALVLIQVVNKVVHTLTNYSGNASNTAEKQAVSQNNNNNKVKATCFILDLINKAVTLNVIHNTRREPISARAVVYVLCLQEASVRL